MATIVLFAAIQIAGFITLFFVFRARLEKLAGLEGRLCALRDEVEALAVDFGEVSERNIGLLEDRIAVMRDLLDEAQSRGTQPGAPARGSAAVPELRPDDGAGESGRGVPGASATAAATAATIPDEGAALPIVLALGRSPGRTLTRGGAESAGPAQHGKSPKTEALDLYRAGFTSEVIAARLGLSVAEVDLIVGLEERRGS